MNLSLHSLDWQQPVIADDGLRVTVMHRDGTLRLVLPYHFTSDGHRSYIYTSVRQEESRLEHLTGDQ